MASTFRTEEDLLRDTISRLRHFIRLERAAFGIIASYSVGIGLFSLIVPLVVSEIVSTFAIAIQPIMIATLSAMVAAALVIIATLRVHQALMVENLIQRLYTRISISMTAALPRLEETSFHPAFANYFLEAEFLPRALVALLSDLLNVTVAGVIGMGLLALYHPYFIIFDVLVVVGFTVLVTILGRGGFVITLKVSDLNYRVISWLQDIANNLAHFKATNSTDFILKKTDELTKEYVFARRTRSDILTRTQYRGVGLFQAVVHASLIGLGGWLLANMEITLGQFVAAEVIVGGLLMYMDTVGRRMYAIYFVFTSLRQLAVFFSLPGEKEAERLHVPVVGLSAKHGVTIVARDVAFRPSDRPPLFERFNVHAEAGEKVAIICRTSRAKTTLAHVLAGLCAPTHGLVRYNDVDLRYLSMESLNDCRGLVLEPRPSLFEGTIHDNIAMGRGVLTHADLQWALGFAELRNEIDALPDGVHTKIRGGGIGLPTSFILRILLARAIITRPSVLIFDGTLHAVLPDMRHTILQRVCSKEEPWTVIFVTTDPTLHASLDQRILLS